VGIEAHSPRTATSLRHDAFVYESDDQFATRMSRFLADGLDEGAAAVAVTSRTNWSLLRETLGDRAADVHFTERHECYSRPAKALAHYDATFRHHLGNGRRSARVLAEVQFGPTPEEWAEWTAYEAIANRAFAHRPAWIVCPYDARALPESVIDDAWRTHPHVTMDGRMPSCSYRGGEALVRAITPKHDPLPELMQLPHPWDAQMFRELLAVRLATADVPAGRRLDMLVAAGEAFANGSKHGGGVTMVRTGLVDDRFVCEVTDAGVGFDDPFAGYLPPRSEHGPGVGLWVARQLTWRVDVLNSPRGLTVRLWL
jgi:anti-sigma regulatory factor (Ser/Thr protein kinase)